ncbi:MAG: hypothetical protein AAB354_08045 [candidate division KSB1 bacterium]
MRKKIIEKNLTKVLLEGGEFSQALFDFELEDRIEEYLQSKHEDGDKFLIAITEKNNDIAMLLIDENDKVHVNEEARALLMKLWRGEVYKKNLRLLIPDMASELEGGYLYFFGVKVASRSAR